MNFLDEICDKANLSRMMFDMPCYDLKTGQRISLSYTREGQAFNIMVGSDLRPCPDGFGEKYVTAMFRI